MVDTVFLEEHLLGRTNYRFAVRFSLRHPDVGRQQLLGRPGLPDVEIVHFRHGRDRQQIVPDFPVINIRWDGVHQGVDRLPDDLVDLPGDDETDGHGDEGVNEPPAEEHDQEGTDNHPEGKQGVLEGMEPGALHVEVSRRDLLEEQGRRAVADKSRDGDPEHLPPGDLRRRRKPLEGFPEDEGDDHGQNDAVDEGGDKFDLAVAVGLGGVGGAAGDPLRPIAEAHGGDVAQVMDGVGDEGHALDDQAEDHLEDDDPAVDHHGEKQVLQRRRRIVIVMVVVFQNSLPCRDCCTAKHCVCKGVYCGWL